MKQYLLSIYQPDEGTPPQRSSKTSCARSSRSSTRRRRRGYGFSGGLHPSNTSTVVRHDRGEFLVTDGPYVEGKEHIGGFRSSNADLDAALEWPARWQRS